MNKVPIIADAREAVAIAIDEAIRELEVGIRYLRLRKADLEGATSPPFVRVFPPREGKA